MRPCRQFLVAAVVLCFAGCRGQEAPAPAAPEPETRAVEPEKESPSVSRLEEVVKSEPPVPPSEAGVEETTGEAPEGEERTGTERRGVDAPPTGGDGVAVPEGTGQWGLVDEEIWRWMAEGAGGGGGGHGWVGSPGWVDPVVM